MDRLTGGLGVDGVFCAGVMSEFWALSASERRRLVTAVVTAAARGKCQVIAHTGHHSVTETIELTRHAEAAGADFAVVINPYYPAAEDDGLYDWFSFVCRNVRHRHLAVRHPVRRRQPVAAAHRAPGGH